MYEKINRKLDDVIAGRFSRVRYDSITYDLLLKIDWAIKWKKVNKEEGNKLLDKLEYIQKNIIF